MNKKISTWVEKSLLTQPLNFVFKFEVGTVYNETHIMGMQWEEPSARLVWSSAVAGGRHQTAGVPKSSAVTDQRPQTRQRSLHVRCKCWSWLLSIQNPVKSKSNNKEIPFIHSNVSCTVCSNTFHSIQQFIL